MPDSIEVRSAIDDPFARLPRWLLEDYADQIGAYGIAVYAALASYTSGGSTCYPSHKSIAKRAGCSARQVRRVINGTEGGEPIRTSLESLGLVDVQHRTSDAGDQTSSVYTLTHPPDCQSAPPGLSVRTPPDCQSDEEDKSEEDKGKEEKIEEERARGKSGGRWGFLGDAHARALPEIQAIAKQVDEGRYDSPMLVKHLFSRHHGRVPLQTYLDQLRRYAGGPNLDGDTDKVIAAWVIASMNADHPAPYAEKILESNFQTNADRDHDDRRRYAGGDGHREDLSGPRGAAEEDPDEALFVGG